MKKRFEHFFSPEKDITISFATNFELDPREEYENVIIFNNGLVCSSQHYKHQIDYFDKLGYKILIHDYRGHFQSKTDQDISTITFKNIAQDVERLTKHCNITSCHLIGHSMGVPVSAYVYLINPSIVKSMVFIGGTLFPIKKIGMIYPITKLLEFKQKEILKPLKRFYSLLWNTSDKNVFFRKIVQYSGFNPKKIDDEYVKFYLSKVSELGFELFAQLFMENNNQFLLSKIKNISIPCLIIAGEKDSVIPHYLQKNTANELPNGHYYFVKNGSHVPQAEFPKLINERITFFLEQNR